MIFIWFMRRKTTICYVITVFLKCFAWCEILESLRLCLDVGFFTSRNVGNGGWREPCDDWRRAYPPFHVVRGMQASWGNFGESSAVVMLDNLGGGFRYFLFSPLVGEDSHFYYIIFFRWVETTYQFLSSSI